MSQIPTDRNIKAKLVRHAIKKLPVEARVPRPLISDEPNEVARNTKLVRALPATRFRTASGKKLVLPQGTADSLEWLEQGLRAVGLIGPNEGCRQTVEGGSAFRVESRDVSNSWVRSCGCTYLVGSRAKCVHERSPTSRGTGVSPVPASDSGPSDRVPQKPPFEGPVNHTADPVVKKLATKIRAKRILDLIKRN